MAAVWTRASRTPARRRSVFHVMPVIAWVDGPAVGLGEQDVMVLPGRAGVEAFGELSGAVDTEERDQFGRDHATRLLLPFGSRNTMPPPWRFGQYCA